VGDGEKEMMLCWWGVILDMCFTPATLFTVDGYKIWRRHWNVLEWNRYPDQRALGLYLRQDRTLSGVNDGSNTLQFPSGGRFKLRPKIEKRTNLKKKIEKVLRKKIGDRDYIENLAKAGRRR
jgi:hypothetical protein